MDEVRVCGCFKEWEDIEMKGWVKERQRYIFSTSAHMNNDDLQIGLEITSIPRQLYAHIPWLSHIIDEQISR